MTDYETYLSKYCTKHHIDTPTAEKHIIVQNYKAYCDEKAAHEKEIKENELKLKGEQSL